MAATDVTVRQKRKEGERCFFFFFFFSLSISVSIYNSIYLFACTRLWT